MISSSCLTLDPASHGHHGIKAGRYRDNGKAHPDFLPGSAGWPTSGSQFQPAGVGGASSSSSLQAGAVINHRHVERRVGKFSTVFAANEKQYGLVEVGPRRRRLSCSLITENINLSSLAADRGGGTAAERRHVTGGPP